MIAKDVGIRIRVEKELRDEFLAACRADKLSASEVLREFMRRYADRRDINQPDLFASNTSPSASLKGDDARN
jgi:antitoxin component of RelBE/YafQ-DinJ toxin-antitoxin module